MAKIETHEKDCIDRLGEPFTEVHLWLDAFAEKYPPKIFDDQHRKYRHNKKGVEEIRDMWGDRAAEAAVLHLCRDFFGAIKDIYFTLWEDRAKEDGYDKEV